MNKNQIQRAQLNSEAQTLDVTWGDRHSSAYPLKYLRSRCPCASCRSDREEARKNPFRVLPAGQRPAGAGIANIQGVGNYGLQFTWNDGHSTGIYTLEYLREICPCPECSAVRVEDQTPYVHGIFIPGK
ncbi:MAG: gamma-butyrobetaine hydroxylase-like domain-containing protein [Actinomycetota bacterium]